MNIFNEYKIIHLCDETDKKIKIKTSSLGVEYYIYYSTIRSQFTCVRTYTLL